MDEDLHKEFFLAFPHPGSRSALIRQIIRSIIKKERIKKNSWTWNNDSEDVANNILQKLEEVEDL